MNPSPSPNNTKIPMGLCLNFDQAMMIKKGLDSLSDKDKSSVNYITLSRDVEAIITIWNRRIKNEKIMQANVKAATKEQRIQIQPPKAQ